MSAYSDIVNSLTLIISCWDLFSSYNKLFNFSTPRINHESNTKVDICEFGKLKRKMLMIGNCVKIKIVISILFSIYNGVLLNRASERSAEVVKDRECVFKLCKMLSDAV